MAANEITGVAKHASLPATIIGATPARFPTAGRIRPGIKVLTQAAARHPRAKQLYDAGVQAGTSYDDIELAITHAVPDLRHPLVPKNVPYFTVRRGDFAMPEVADLILEKFGEARGDGERHLYRFPAVFPADNWQAVMPHALMCYGSSELKYWSEYSPDGHDRYCMTFASIPRREQEKRAIRIFGGRKHVRRAENDGQCDPERCPEYQARQCNLTGRFVFLIPGIPSLNVIELPTNSFYAMNAARQTLETVAFLRGGRISGFLEGKTAFWITKRSHEVAMIDDEGHPRRVAQWLIELEAPVDLTRLLQAESDDAGVARGERAAALLAAAPAAAVGAFDDALWPTMVGTAETERADGGPGDPEAPTVADGPEGPRPEHVSDTTPVEGQRIATLYALVDELRIPRDHFERFARRKFGAGWSRNVNGIRRVSEYVGRLDADGGSVLEAMETELDLSTSRA